MTCTGTLRIDGGLSGLSGAAGVCSKSILGNRLMRSTSIDYTTTFAFECLILIPRRIPKGIVRKGAF